ncbi:hypothetical protein NQ314_006841 [Rhamnusium bicolor]|uniref:Cytochrome P450 n=1 Tax=Rhamnusium bicolor TaxID=1586634 RepID=A0AAV8YW79_9CUCU|nr:hypothetical protein NQ314_006841 [Rhamnusium bicolor]
MLVLSIFAAIIAVILIPVLYWFLIVWKYSSLRNIPGPKPLPIIGNLNEIGKTTVDLLQSLIKLQNKYGSLYKLWFGPKLHLVMSKPEYLEQLLTSNIHLTKSDGYDLFRPFLGDGLLVTTGEKWRSRRKMITPTFHFKILEEFMTVFNKQFDVLVDIECVKTLHDFTNNIINERKEELRTKGENSRRVSDDGIKRKSALLDMLLEATFNGEHLSNEDIREEVDTFMFEGHDTTSSAISYTLYALAHNKDVQQKLYNELVEVLGTDSKSEVTISQINELKYLDIVLKEALRIYPSGPFIERTLDSDWTIGK